MACIAGNLVRDAVLSHTTAGVAVLNFTVAVNDRRKNSETGEWEQIPNFIDCSMFGKRAEALSGMLVKGTGVAVEGKLRQNQWVDEETGQHRSRITVIANDIDFAGSRDRDRTVVPDSAVGDLGF